MLDDSTLLAIEGLLNAPAGAATDAVSAPAFPSAVAIDLAPGTNAAPLVARIADAGRWAWSGFAMSLGVVPVTVIPGLALLAGLAALFAQGTC